MKNLDEMRDIEQRCYHNNLAVHLDDSEAIAFKTGWDLCTKLKDEEWRKVVEGLLEALRYYSKHESVIKEAYHSNEERQITVVHTFINHKAIEALEDYEKKLGKK